MIGEIKGKYLYLNEYGFTEKIDYSYSKFEGENFIKFWENTRLKCLETLKKFKSSNSPLNTDQNKTFKLLEKWINDYSELEKDIHKVHLLVKRFEVTKRIYDDYDNNFRRLNNKTNYKNLNNYISFSLVLSVLYEKKNHLQYLNSILKLNDIICSLILTSHEIKLNVERSILILNKELSFIKKIMNDFEKF